MVRKSKPKPKPSVNSLVEALRDGKPVIGLTGYTPITSGCSCDDKNAPLFVLVKIVGMKADEGTCSDVKIVGELLSGLGQIIVDPNQFYTTLDDVKKQVSHAAALAAATDAHRLIGADHYLHTVRHNLEEYARTKMSPEQLKDFWIAVVEAGDAVDLPAADADRSFKPKVSRDNLKKWSAIACLQANGLPTASADSICRYSW